MDQDDFLFVMLPLLFVLLMTLITLDHQEEAIDCVKPELQQPQVQTGRNSVDEHVRYVSHSGTTPRAVHF